jgi:hypothetical protein
LLAVGVAILLPVLVILLLISAFYSYRATRTGIPDMPLSAAYFKHIARQPLGEYQAFAIELTHPEALRAMLHYNYSVAQQATLKFSRVERSLRFMRVAILLWILLLLVIAVAD